MVTQQRPLSRNARNARCTQHHLTGVGPVYEEETCLKQALAWEGDPFSRDNVSPYKRRLISRTPIHIFKVTKAASYLHGCNTLHKNGQLKLKDGGAEVTSDADVL